MYPKIKAAVKAKNKSIYGQIILILWLEFVICVWKKGNYDMNIRELFFSRQWLEYILPLKFSNIRGSER